jgi:hypothetical protein
VKARVDASKSASLLEPLRKRLRAIPDGGKLTVRLDVTPLKPDCVPDGIGLNAKQS